MRIKGQKCDPFSFCNTRGNSGDKILSFPFSTIVIKYVGSFVGLSYRPHSIPMNFHDEFGFLVAQFNSPYLLHSSSYENLLVGLGFFIAQSSVP